MRRHCNNEQGKKQQTFAKCHDTLPLSLTDATAVPIVYSSLILPYVQKKRRYSDGRGDIFCQAALWKIARRRLTSVEQAMWLKHRKRKKRDVWIALLLLTPVVFVGIFVLSATPKEMKHPIEHLYSVDDADFVHSISAILGPPIVGGNRATTLLNGNDTFPAMLASIRNARQTIDFETFIYWSGQVGKSFSNALSERARSGVHVKVTLDWAGSNKVDKKMLDEMEAAGVQIVRYHPPNWYSVNKWNNRTHRKILVVDGQVGFTGGIGVADQWLGNAEDEKHWRDTHFEVEGPVVSQLQSVFIENWVEARSELLHGPLYFPIVVPAGEMSAQAFKSAAEDSSESAYLMYMLSIASARKEILISNAYFVPDEFSVQTLVAAARRGVRVRLLVPGKLTDTAFVRRASRDRWGELLRAGVEFYEFQPTMFHCKVMVIDRLWSSVGSTNFDNRSFKLNDEVNLNILDAGFAERQAQIFADDVKRSRRISLREWENRPWTDKFKEFFAGLFRNQL